MTVSELLERIKPHVGAGKYRMGGGALDPRAPSPFGEDGTSDCSAFTCWSFGLRKYQPDPAWLARTNGGWLNTTGIYVDATRERTGWFDAIEHPEIGCAIVYPGKGVVGGLGPRVGHIGIVVGFDREGSPMVAHCSFGNYRSGEGAIQVTSAKVFDRVASTVYAWCTTVERVEREAA